MLEMVKTLILLYYTTFDSWCLRLALALVLPRQQSTKFLELLSSGTPSAMQTWVGAWWWCAQDESGAGGTDLGQHLLWCLVEEPEGREGQRDRKRWGEVREREGEMEGERRKEGEGGIEGKRRDKGRGGWGGEGHKDDRAWYVTMQLYLWWWYPL